MVNFSHFLKNKDQNGKVPARSCCSRATRLWLTLAGLCVLVVVSGLYLGCSDKSPVASVGSPDTWLSNASDKTVISLEKIDPSLPATQ